jgi:hypothetical protein
MKNAQESIPNNPNPSQTRMYQNVKNAQGSKRKSRELYSLIRAKAAECVRREFPIVLFNLS